VFLSTRSVEKIGYVQREFRRALHRSEEMPEGVIHTIPVKLDDCTVPRGFSHHQWANLYEEGAFDRIVRALHHGLQQRRQPLPEPLIPDPSITGVLEDTDRHAEPPKVANAVIKAINPFLSEFDNKWFKWIGLFLSHPGGKWIIAGLACVTTAITIRLGSLAKANCISVYLQADSKVANLLFGYLAELNHALTYLVLVPTFIVIVFMFLMDFGSALEDLEKGGGIKWKSADGTIGDYPPHIGKYLGDLRKLNHVIVLKAGFEPQL